MAQAAGTVKKVSLELGGHAPLIVFDDADIELAVQGAMGSKFRNAGQTCVCANRILVQAGVYDVFAARLAEAVKELKQVLGYPNPTPTPTPNPNPNPKQGPGAAEGVTIGPLIDGRAVAKAEAHVDDALRKGATLLVGGGRVPALGPNFYAPTLLGDATTDMDIFREETFGPVAPLFRFDSEEDAVRMANDTPYGLAAYFFTRDLGRAWRVSEALEYLI